MLPFRVIRSGVLLTGLLAALGVPLHAASGSFTTTLSLEQKSDAGLTGLTAGELAALDRLVAEEVASARQSNASALIVRFSLRQTDSQRKEAGLDRLTPEQRGKLDELIATTLATGPQPRERPRLKDSEILSERGRLQVHGGMSFTYGWAGGGRNYREAAAWVSYFDPVTGLGLGFGFSRFSGDVFPGYYGSDFYSDAPYVYSAPRTSFFSFDRGSMDRNEFTGDGASLRYPTGGRSSGRGFRH